MRYLAGLILAIFFIGCNGDGSSKQQQGADNAPQPSVQNRELQPPKPPSL